MPPTKVGWQSSPKARGTSDLLFSCATTLFLCAWTAYHPNVPTGRSKRSRLAHRLVWMLIAIVVPEGVLWCAWEQWWTARKLRQQVNAIISQEHTEISGGEDEECRVCKVEDKQEAKSVITEIVPVDGHAEPEPENTAESIEGSITRTESAASTPQKEEILVKREEPWTLEQAFFALAGGYALPSTVPSLPPVPLTANGVLLLCRLGVLPSTPPSAISDKSKADAFAKALVCVQAGWFIVQMIARAIAKLPITTLEVHVLAHVLCAFAIYAVWFEKGYDIGDAIVIDSEEGRALGALFEMEGVESHCYDITKKVVKCACSSPDIDASLISLCSRPTIRHSSAMYWEWLVSQFTERPTPNSRTTKTDQDLDSASPHHAEQVERANYALRLLKENNVHLPYREETMTRNGIARRHIVVKQPYTVPVRSNLKIEGLGDKISESRSDFRERTIKTYALIAFLYGAVHLCALTRAHFPTHVEYYLWLASTISMLVAPLSLTLLLYGMRLSAHIDSALRTKTATSKILLRIGSIGLETVLLVVWILVFASFVYPFARGYVLIESLIGLRSVDKRVYDVVQWTGWIPHA